MASTAYQTIYREEFIHGFEQRQSDLRTAVVTNANTDGKTAVFLVADSNDATAKTRGADGLIPARADSQTQNSCTLAEWHDLVRKTNFNVDLSQGDQRRMMQETSMGVINRKIDTDILAQLDTATNDTGAYTTMTVSLVAKSLAILGNNQVPINEQENMFGVLSPAAWAYLMQTKEFSSGEYVEQKTFSGAIRKFYRWFGVNWLMSPLVTGVGTSTEKLYVFHRNSIGHAFASETMQTPVGYNEEQDYSYARCSAYMGSKLLQNSGIVQIKHDGSAYTAS